MIRVVIDTNVLISAIFYDGLCEDVINDVIDGYLISYANEEIIREYGDSILKFREKIGSIYKQPKLVANFYRKIIITEKINSDSISRDKDDDKFVNCALDSEASYIISGDKDLLEIKEYKGIKIITPREYYELRKKLSDA